jgi:hypothetical protein
MRRIAPHLLLLVLLSPAFAADPQTLRGPTTMVDQQGTSTTIQDSKTGKVLGTVTHSCLDRGDGRSYFLTNYHVVEESTSGLSVGDQGTVPAKLEFADSCMDLALVSTPLTASSMICTEFPPAAGGINAEKVYEIEAAANQPKTTVDIESYDIDRGQMDRRRFDTVAGLSPANGLPGRECTGSLLLIDGHGLFGMSGGAAIGRFGPDGKLALQSDDEKAGIYSPFSGTRHELLGLISGIDRAHREIAIIPAPVIEKRILQYFEDPKKYGSRITEKSVPGGVEYTDSGAIHYRGGEREIFDSGTGNAPPTGSGNQPPPGSGNQPPPGSGNQPPPGSGNQPPPGASLLGGSWATGISTVDHPDRRWLSIGDFWSELDPYPLDRRALLKTPASIEGIYETKDHELYATSAKAPLPKLIAITNKDSPCYESSALQRKTGTEITYPVTVSYCEIDSGHGKILSILYSPPRDNPAKIAPTLIQIRLDENCATSPCPVSITAKSYTVGDLSLSQLEGLTRSPESLAKAPSNSLIREGLRQYESDQASVAIESTSGYQLALKNKNATWVVTGPVQDPTQSSNLGFIEATKWVESVEKQTEEIQNSLRSPPGCNQLN